MTTQGAPSHPQRDRRAAPTSTTFADLDLCDNLLAAISDQGYDTPTPIQAQAIPHLLDGRDLLGVAQTGTGKTAAFALPLLDYLDDVREERRTRCPRALVLTPTRELASQIGASFEAYGDHLSLRSTVIFGGVGQSPQVRAMRAGVDILVATPGRLLDLMNQKHIDLSRVEVFILDEADRMLDMGFLRDVRRVIAKLPDDRQSILFSATMPNDISELAKTLLHDPVRVEVTPPSTTVETIEQRVCFVEKSDKRALLCRILEDDEIERVLVFTRTKHGANRVAQTLDRAHIPAGAIHGNKSQGARTRALSEFRAGNLRVLVATDIAARGLDVEGITHVINFDLPNIPESYVHRIGRTARAGRDGIAISFCDGTERAYLRAIQKEIGRDLDVVEIPRFSRSPRQDGARNGNGNGNGNGARNGGGNGRPQARRRRRKGARR